jgi:hypothetical protein
MTFIAKQFQRVITMKSWTLVVKNQELHQIYTKAYDILADWPDNYYSFLDWKQEKERNALPSYQKSLFTTTKDFGGFYTGLQTTLAGKQFKFMRTAFKTYLQEYPNGRHGSAINIYMPRSEAMKRLQMSKQRIHQLAKAGHLKVKVIKRCGQSIHLIEIASIRKLESKLS